MAATTCDAIVVGSGGWAAKGLAGSGLRVLILDCGRPQTNANFTEPQRPFDLKYRNIRFREPVSGTIRKTRPIQGQCYAFTEYNYDWFANGTDEPYTTAPGMPYGYFGRSRVVGGRANVWGRQSYRQSDLDFKARAHDDFGEDWPVSYKDVAPY